MNQRFKRAALRILLYMIALLLGQLAFAEHFDYTEVYVQNFMFTIMVIVEGGLLWWDNRHA